MKRILLHAKRILCVLLSVLGVFLVAPQRGLAQSGKLAGTVTDAATGEALPGVNILVQGTKRGGATNAQGEYTIIGLSPGEYDVRFSQVGHAPKTVEGVLITSNRTRRLDVELSPEAVQAEEVVVQAERPVVKADQTTSRTLYTNEEIERLPATNLQDVISNTAKSFDGFVRGSRRFSTSTVVEGVDVSDDYARASSINQNARRGYGNAVRTSEVGSSLFNLNAGGIQEVSVNTGATDASAPSGAGGVVNVTLTEGRGPISGSASFRIAPQINQPGPDSLAFYPDDEVNAFLNERQEILDKGNEKLAEQYSFRRGKYDVGEDPEMNFNFSLGGAITDNLRFSTSGQFFQSHGFRPNEFNRRVNAQLKTSYDFSDNTTLTGIALVQDNGLWGGWNNRNYSELWRYYLQGTAQDDGGSYVGSLRLRQVISSNAFLTAQVYRTYARTRYGFADDDGDGKIEQGEDGDFINFLKTKNIAKYNWLGPEDPLEKAFYGGPFPPGRTSVEQPSGEPVRASGPLPYYEDAQRAKNGFKLDYSQQVTSHHLLQAGVDLNRTTVDYAEARPELFEFNYTLSTPGGDNDINGDGVVDKEPFAPSQYERHPTTYSAYLSDRIEYGNLIVNLGLRTDLVDRDMKKIRDYFYPFRRDTVMADGRLVARNFFDRGEDVPVDVFWNPRIGVSHPISKRAAIYFSYARSEELVPYSTLYDFYDGNHSADQFLTFQDPEQDPIISNNYELGVQWEFFEGWGLDVNAYARSIDNYGRQSLRAKNRTPEGEPDLGFNRYVFETSAGYADVRGIEVQVQRHPLEFFEGFSLGVTGSYTFSSVEANKNVGNQTKFLAEDFEDNQLPFDRIDNFQNYPKEVSGGNSTISNGYNRHHRALLRAVGTLPYGFSFGLDGRYESGFLYKKIIDADPRDRELLTGPANFRIDLRLEKRFDFTNRFGADLFLDIKNLTNRDNIVSYNSNISDQGRRFEKNGNPGPRLVNLDGSPTYDIARNFYFGTRIRF